MFDMTNWFVSAVIKITNLAYTNTAGNIGKEMRITNYLLHFLVCDSYPVVVTDLTHNTTEALCYRTTQLVSDITIHIYMSVYTSMVTSNTYTRVKSERV